MKDVNEVHLVGRAGKDAEVKYTSGGKELAKFSLATGGGKKKDGSGEWPTDWHNIECWDVPGASAIAKGEVVEVFGRIKYDSWDDRTTGQKKYMTKIVASKLQLPDDDRPRRQEQAEPQQSQRDTRTEVTDEDLPF